MMRSWYLIFQVMMCVWCFSLHEFWMSTLHRCTRSDFSRPRTELLWKTITFINHHHLDKSCFWNESFRVKENESIVTWQQQWKSTLFFGPLPRTRTIVYTCKFLSCCICIRSFFLYFIFKECHWWNFIAIELRQKPRKSIHCFDPCPWTRAIPSLE